YVQEPGKLRRARDEYEIEQLLTPEQIDQLFPPYVVHRVALTHMRPEVFRGHLWHLFAQAQHSDVLGYINKGGTLDEFGMQFANKATWAHVLQAYAHSTKTKLQDYLSP